METTVMAPARFTTRVGQARQSAWAWSLTVALHLLAAAAVVIVPLLGDESLPSENAAVARAFFATPALALAPAPPPPPPPPAAARPATAPRAPKETSSTFTAPVEVPETILAETGLDVGLEGGVPGGVEGGVPGGVVGGVVGGLDTAPPPPPQVVRVGGLVREPRKVKHVSPVYPNIAIAAKIQGVVILECMISPQGRVESVRPLRGVPALDDAAVEAVRQWVYTPTLLGGVPVAVVMTVTVNFVLRDAASY